MVVTTPLRTPKASGDTPTDPPSARDPISSRLLDILASTRDLSSWSDELSTQVESWSDRYHLSPQRSNILRGLPLGAPAAVLEIGAAAGAVTRYLGEISPLVDALEPDPALAAVARARCADLPHVMVHTLTLDAVPVEPAYDLIVATEILASTGSASQSLTDLLSTCRALLRPGGHIVVAVDNAEGARRLAGGGLPRPRPGGHAPILSSRAALAGAAVESGLGAQVLGAFPDHRHATRLIDHAALRAIDVSLLDRLVSLPSPPYEDDEIPADLEQQAWSAAVSAGVDADRPNSFVLVAGDIPVNVDPVTYWSSGRRADLSACNRMRDTTEGPVVVRALAYPEAPPLGGPLSLRAHTEPYIPGTSLVELVSAATTPDEAVPFLQMWLDLVAAHTDSDRVPWDLIPRNVQVDSDGTAHAIDQEWEHEGADQISTLRRGSFWLAYDLLFTAPTPVWLGGQTVVSAADVLTALMGQPVATDWREILDAEAISMASLAPRSARDSLAAKIRKERRNVSYLSEQPPQPEETPVTRTAIEGLSAANRDLRARVEKLELDRRHDEIVARDHAIGLRAKLETALAELAQAQEQTERQGRRVRKLQAEIESIRASTSWRLGRTITRPAARLTKRRRE